MNNLFVPPPAVRYRFEQCLFKKNGVLSFPSHSYIRFEACTFKTGTEIRFNDAEYVTIELCNIESGVIWDRAFDVAFERVNPGQSLDLIPPFSFLRLTDGKTLINRELTPNIILPHCNIIYYNCASFQTVRSIEILVEAMWQNPFLEVERVHWGVGLDDKLTMFKRLQGCKCYDYKPAVTKWKPCKCRYTFASLFAVLSAKEVKRVGRYSALKKLPKDLVRMCASFLM